jgi:hypothetical protein
MRAILISAIFMLLTINTVSANPIAMASQFIGATASQLGLPNRLWCADFMNKLFGG